MFCLPCRVLDDGDRDGIPNVLVEAMACGAAGRDDARSRGSPSSSSDGVNGLLVAPDDAEALAAALLRAADDPTSRAPARPQPDARRCASASTATGSARRLAALFEEAIA